ncbi:hypothetical protein ACHAXT_002431 [Thalassiosira profunda]
MQSAAATAVTALLGVALLAAVDLAHANPKSRPYVAYRTDPFDQDIVARRILEDGAEQRGTEGRIHKNEVTRQPSKRKEEDPRCPLSFRLGSTHSAHFGASSRTAAQSDGTTQNNGQHTGVGTHTAPIIYPLHPDFDAGSGRQILLTTDYEVLEMWTPSSGMGTRSDVNPESGKSSGGVEGQSAEQLKEDEQFPLLFESSSFYHTSPIVHDVEGDGIADAILGDYDGNLHMVGLDFEHADSKEDMNRHQRRRRYYRRLSIPRLYVRKGWYDTAINKTSEAKAVEITTAQENHTKWEDFEPYHTYFAGTGEESWRGKHDEEALRGVSGDVLNMDIDMAKGLAKRRKLKDMQSQKEEKAEDEKEEKGDGEDERVEGASDESATHRRLQEVVNEPEANHDAHGVPGSDMGAGRAHDHYADDYNFDEDPGLYDDGMGAPPDGTESAGHDLGANWGDDYYPYDDMKRQHEDELGSNEDGAVESIHSDPDDADHPDYPIHGMDDYYGRYGYGDDMYKPEAPEGWDSYDQYQEAQDKYYHNSNYLRLPPHLLSTCSLVELPRAYAGTSTKAEDRVDELVLCAVSYYFDEDECRDPSKAKGKSFGKHANADGGDEREEQRGRYVASAILGYNLRWKYWSLQEVLDLSTDWSAPLGDIAKGGTAGINSDSRSGMGAWALATPVAARLDGGDKNHVIVGTSMGLVYALEVQWHGSRSGWPVQMRHPIEQKVLVEDVVGNTNLEVFVVDAGGDIVSLDVDGDVLWARSLLKEDETDLKSEVAHVVRGTSPMSMGDVEGTGKLAIVLLARIATTDRDHVSRPDKHEVLEYRLYAIDAVTGDDLPHFPIAVEGGSSVSHTSPIPQPLLIDLHENQQHWLDRIHGISEETIASIRAINVDAARHYDASETNPRPHGGAGRGVHVVQPLGSTLHIIEGATACEQTIDVGDTIPAMVQADDVHGTGGLDLVVTTSQGEILTLESDVVPYHALNVWSAGVSRAPGSHNAQAHGFSSSQGIFIHPISRQFRDILGIYVPVTFEIFDRRRDADPGRTYQVDVRAGMNAKRTVFSHTYDDPGVYTERIQIPYGPGYYAFSVVLRTSHGIVYEDTFHIGWNVNYMGGLWLIVCLPLVLAAIPILLFKRQPNWEEDDDFALGSSRGGILGRTS